jgi:hypothetical protein
MKQNRRRKHVNTNDGYNTFLIRKQLVPIEVLLVSVNNVPG